MKARAWLSLFAVLLLTAQVACIPYKEARISITNVDSNGDALAQVSDIIEQLGYARMDVYSVTEGRSAQRVKEEDKISIGFESPTSGGITIIVTLDPSNRLIEFGFGQAAFEITAEFKERYKSLVDALAAHYGHDRVVPEEIPDH